MIVILIISIIMSLIITMFFNYLDKLEEKMDYTIEEYEKNKKELKK